MLKSVFKSLFAISLAFTFSSYAGDFSWSGLYRIEGLYLNKPQLTGNKDKDYGMHHLILRPRIDAADGLTIRSRIDLFNNSTYANSQLGSYFGNGVGGGKTYTDDSNAISQNQKAETMAVNELYVTLVQEFGALIAGRVPLQFGLGATYSAGHGMFDHYFDNRDLVGYKMVFGNFWLLPMMGKVNEGQLGDTDDVSENMIQMEYENPETELNIGAFYRVPNISQAANDAPGSPVFGDVASPTRSDKFNVSYLNFYTKKKTKNYTFGIELASQDGDSGVENSSGTKVKVNGSAIVGEFEYHSPESKWKYGINFGQASGDDPNTSNKYEGYVLDRNYNVALLLMNHQLGQANIFRTSYMTGKTTPEALNAPDIEAVSNVTYLAPYFNYKWNDKWDFQGKLITGFLMETKNLTGASKTTDSNIGTEIDLGFHYKPNKNIVWSTEAAVLMPGSAFEVDGTYKSELAYGLSTRAAIKF